MRPSRSTFTALLLVLVGLSGCGSADVEREIDERRERFDARVDEVRDRVEGFRDDLREVSEEVERRVREALEDLERTVPRAGPSTPQPSSEGLSSIGQFLDRTLRDIDAYWTQTFRENGQPEPRVGFVSVPQGRAVRSGCGAQADDTAAFYCPADDTIYIGERLAAAVFEGVADGFPGQRAGYGRAVGDFGVAYLAAHEYAHQVQDELGFFDGRRRGESAKPFELQADCLAGVWGASAFRRGAVDDADVEEALATALAVGDFEVGSEQHHGTPEERRDAWLLGFESGEPASCDTFVRA
jgi:uncharacterized protein